MRKQGAVTAVLLRAVGASKPLALGVFAAVMAAVAVALLPPLVLEQMVDRLTEKQGVPFLLALAYFGFTTLASLLDTARESLLTFFGQRITRRLRGALCQKLSRLPAEAFVSQRGGAIASLFVGDVDTVEALFTSGVVSMFADGCKLLSLFAVICVKNRGLALLLLALLPLLFCFTRTVQRRMLAAQVQNRAAVARVAAHVPESIRCIRTVQMLGKQRYMREKYDRCLQESYDAVEKTNFYDAVYSPVILMLNALTVAAVMLLSATGRPGIRAFFGMSAGTAVAVIAYISQIFSPLASIGMEIQTVQSAMAGVKRIDDYLCQPERWATEEGLAKAVLAKTDGPCVELRDLTFGYDPGAPVLENLSFTIARGEQVTLAGRTGAGKTTVFKLLLGLYRPQAGQALVNGQDAALLPDSVKRRLFGYVEQRFRRVPGTVLDQITLFDEAVSPAQAERAAQTVGLHDAILRLPQGYRTPCAQGLFSQGQWQLLSIARAIAAQPEILLLDEITANLDADTEQLVLAALKKASAHRTILSVSHRLYQQTGGRRIMIGAEAEEATHPGSPL